MNRCRHPVGALSARYLRTSHKGCRIRSRCQSWAHDWDSGHDCIRSRWFDDNFSLNFAFILTTGANILKKDAKNGQEYKSRVLGGYPSEIGLAVTGLSMDERTGSRVFLSSTSGCTCRWFPGFGGYISDQEEAHGPVMRPTIEITETCAFLVLVR